MEARASVAATVAALGLVTSQVFAADYPAPQEGDFVAHGFKFASGDSLPELRIHYQLFGQPRRDSRGVVRNAVLIVHGTGGSGNSLIRPEFAGELFGPGQPLDATRYFIVLPDALGHGKSSKPSDGLHARFPRYGYNDMVESEYRLLTEELGVKHARLIMGTSMGCMHTWLWGEQHPDFMDALMPLACLPTQISGRNRVWRRTISDAIRNDPEWQGGNYTRQPQSARTAAQMLWLVSSNPVIRHRRAPTLAQADKEIDDYVANWLRTGDVNDQLYALESSFDYDPGPGLEKITAPLLAINSADDLVNPPEIGLLEQEIKRVPKGRFVMIPLSARTAGHGTHTAAAVWKSYLVELLKESE